MLHTRTTIRWVISVGLIAWLVSWLDWTAVGRILGGADYWLGLWAIMAGLTLIAGIAFRLWLMLRWGGLSLPWTVVWRVTWTGQFLNCVLPGSTGGDIYKIYEISRQLADRSPDGAAAVLADRLYALLALLMLVGVSVTGSRIPWIDFLAGNLAVRASLLAVALLMVAGLVTGVYWRRELSSRIALLGRVFGLVEVTLRQMAGYFCRPKVIGLAFLAAVFVHLGNFFVVFLLARSLHLSLSFVDVLTLMPILMLVLLLPVTVNGHGLREIMLVGFFGWLGVSREGAATGFRESAIALSVMLVACDLICNLPGGFWSLWHRRCQTETRIQPPAFTSIS